jgi:hypothetical protein
MAFGALALSVQETGSLQTASIPTSGLGNVVAASTTSADDADDVDADDVDASPSSTDSASAAGSGSTVVLQTNQNQATDEAISNFDPTDLWDGSV